MSKYNLIFDCDGTIFDSYDSICEWIFRVFKSLGIETDINNIRHDCLSEDVNYAIEQVCLKHNLDFKTVKEISNSFEQNLDLIKPYPNLNKVLDNNLFDCYIYTHRGVTCNELLKRNKLEDKFVEVVNKTYGFKKKPDPQAIEYLINKYKLDRNKTYYIGDRIIDIKCGKNSNIKTIFYKSNPFNIECNDANLCINDLDDINKILI